MMEMCSKSCTNPKHHKLDKILKRHHQYDDYECHEPSGPGIISKILKSRKFSEHRTFQKLINEFNKAKTDSDRAFAMLKYMANLSLLPFNKKDNAPSYASLKSSEKSTELRTAGNEAFVKKKQDALELYTKSIAAAPYRPSNSNVSEELSLAFGNRSALLFATKDYVPCLNDIKQAFSHHYPKNLHYKLLERKGKCLYFLERFEEAIATFKEARVLVQDASSFPGDKINSLVTSLSQLQIKSEKKKLMLSSCRCEHAALSDNNVPPIPQKTHGQNCNIPSIANCLEIEESKEMGRYLEATKDIKLGDVLVVEKPYASVLIPASTDNRFTHCHHCMQRNLSLIPCHHCSLAMFCSEKCLKTAWEVYHRIECGMLVHLYHLGYGYTPLLILRILLVATHKSGGLRALYNNLPILEEQSRKAVISGFNSSGRYEWDDYGALHELMRYSESIPTNFLRLSACVAVCLMNCLDVYSVFFSEISPATTKEPEPNWKVFAAGLMLRYMHIVAINGHAVTELVRDPRHSENQITLGGAIYTTAPLINHSCVPNVTHSFTNGNIIVANALSDIQKGKQIFTSYDCHYQKMPLAERTEWLQKYFCVTCRCQACLEDWPVCADSMKQSFAKMKWQCINCSEDLFLKDDKLHLFCPKCHFTILLSEVRDMADMLVEKYATLSNNMKSDCYIDCTNNLANSLTKFKKIAKLPNDIIFLGEEMLAECFQRKGNFYSSM